MSRKDLIWRGRDKWARLGKNGKNHWYVFPGYINLNIVRLLLQLVQTLLFWWLIIYYRWKLGTKGKSRVRNKSMLKKILDRLNTKSINFLLLHWLWKILSHLGKTSSYFPTVLVCNSCWSVMTEVPIL